MIGVEALLPQGIARMYQPKDFVEPLRERVDLIRPTGDVIDWSLVSPDVSSDATRLVGQFGYINETERLAMYRGSLFARQLIFMLYGEGAITKMPELPVSPQTGLVVESVREATCEKVMTYISNYPWIDDILGAYTYELDPNSLYGHRIEEIGGYVIMQGEMCAAEWALFEKATQLRPEDIISC